jgi:hypothetical protein
MMSPVLSRDPLRRTPGIRGAGKRQPFLTRGRARKIGKAQFARRSRCARRKPCVARGNLPADRFLHCQTLYSEEFTPAIKSELRGIELRQETETWLLPDELSSFRYFCLHPRRRVEKASPGVSRRL